MADMKKMRNSKKTYKEIKQEEEISNHPVNQFLNARNEDGSYTFPVAKKLMKYFIANPDLILQDQRKAYAYYHELKWRKNNMIQYKIDSELEEGRKSKDKHGEIMDQNNCYLAYLSEKINIKATLAQLRKVLVGDLLGKVDGENITFEQFNELVQKFEEIVKAEGYELFPEHIELVEDL